MNDHEKITTTTVWMTNFTLLVWLENRQKKYDWKKTEERKTETEKNNMTKVIVYYNVRKMCEKNPFVIKDTHLLLRVSLRHQLIFVWVFRTYMVYPIQLD
jgi:hypothetical protein